MIASHLINESALLRLSPTAYERILQSIVSFLFEPPMAVFAGLPANHIFYCAPNSDATARPKRLQRWQHRKAFAEFALLAMSPLGGYLHRSALNDVCEVQLQHVAHMLSEEQRILIVPRGPKSQANSDREETSARPSSRLAYPVYTHPCLRIAALSLVTQQMRAGPIRNNALAAIAEGTCLAPKSENAKSKDPTRHRQYRKTVIQAFLEIVSSQSIQEPASIEDFIQVGRFTMSRMYSPDVFYAALGELETTTPASEQVLDPELLPKLAAPFRLPEWFCPF